MVKLGPMGDTCLKCGRGAGHAGPCTTDHLVHRCYWCDEPTYCRRCANIECRMFGRWIDAFPPEPNRLVQQSRHIWHACDDFIVAHYAVLTVALAVAGFILLGIVLWRSR